ncbi:hypothetical protein Misp06_01597 [Microbulbifer sp. NBRC 101763]
MRLKLRFFHHVKKRSNAKRISKMAAYHNGHFFVGIEKKII